MKMQYHENSTNKILFVDGFVRGMLSVSIKLETVVFEGIPIKNANGEFACDFVRKICNKVYQ